MICIDRTWIIYINRTRLIYINRTWNNLYKYDMGNLYKSTRSHNSMATMTLIIVYFYPPLYQAYKKCRPKNLTNKIK